MLERAKKSWRELKKGEPGKRFQERYRKRHEDGGSGKGKRVLMLGGGFAVLVVGLVMMPAPGPGIVVVVLAAGMISGESQWMSRLLDRAELLVRAVLAWAKDVWAGAGLAARGAMVLVGLALAGAAAWLAWRILF